MSSDFFENFSLNACSYREECKSIRTLLQADAATYQSQHYWRALALQREQRIEELEVWQRKAKKLLLKSWANTMTVGEKLWLERREKLLSEVTDEQ